MREYAEPIGMLSIKRVVNINNVRQEPVQTDVDSILGVPTGERGNEGNVIAVDRRIALEAAESASAFGDCCVCVRDGHKSTTAIRIDSMLAVRPDP